MSEDVDEKIEASVNSSDEIAFEKSESRNTNKGCTLLGKVTSQYGPVSDANIVIGDLSITTDMKGGFEFGGLKSGEYKVEVIPALGWKYKRASATVFVGDEESKNLDFYLEYQTETVEGHVVDEDGVAIENAVVSGVLSGQDTVTAVSDSSGRFTFEQVPPGKYYLRAKADGYMAGGVDLVSTGEKTSITVTLNRGAHKVYGTVSSDRGGPLAAEIRLLKGGIVVQMTESSKGTGKYEFADLSEGVYEVLTNAPNHYGRTWHGKVEGDVKVDFPLTYFEKIPGQEFEFRGTTVRLPDRMN